MKNLLVRLLRDEEGQDLIEYGLLVGIITVGTIVVVNTIGVRVTAYFQALLNDLNANPPQ